jgi:carbon storage regulator
MLILSRKVGERIAVGEDVTIVVNRISGNRVALGIEAPKHVRVVRGELERFADEFSGGDQENSAGPDVVPTSVSLGDVPGTSLMPRNAR